MDIKAYLTSEAKICDKIIKSHTDGWRTDNSTLADAMGYYLTGGKRLRMIMCREAARLFTDGVPESVNVLAAAIEFIHTYSLIHDDLPAMDNDDFRRCVPSCHKKFGEATAILAGDALLNYAYESLFLNLTEKPNAALLAAANLLSKCAGYNGLLYGQSLDLSVPNPNAKQKELINTRKTAVLFTAAAGGGAILSGAAARSVSDIIDFSESFGLAFQLADDCTDGDPTADPAPYLEAAKKIIKPYDKHGFFTDLCGYIGG